MKKAKTTTVADAKSQVEASGEQLSAPRIDAIVARAMSKVVDHAQALQLTSFNAGAVAARKICTLW